tara:strand:+ start:1454 stop:2641 length:1188 start_codon:yes stop_codon:yes gene_type:complete
MNQAVFFTVTNYSYLNKALALKKSFKVFNPNINFKIYLFEEKTSIPHNKFENEYELTSEMNIPNYYNLAFKYDVVEFTTSLKPYLTLQLLKKFNKVVFLDPDVFVYNSFKPLLDLLNKNDIILTPHYIFPKISSDDSDLGMMKYGSFNLGFYAVYKSKNSTDFLNWWHDKCKDQCYFETHNGLSTDQKWVSIANVFFDVYNLKDPGYNFSYWNVHERNILKKNNQLLVDDSPLTFIHFSNFIESSNSSYLSSRSNIRFQDIANNSILVKLHSDYRSELISFKSNLDLKYYSYSYDKIKGMYISLILRRIYGFNYTRFEVNPFNDDKLFLFGKKNNLISKSKSLKNKNENDLSVLKKSIIRGFLRLIIKIFGGKKINNLLRLFVYLSSPQRIKNLY